MTRPGQNVPDVSDQAAMQKLLEQAEHVDEQYRKLCHKDKIEKRKDILGRYGLFLPLCIVAGYYLVLGLLEGKIKNFLFDIDRYKLSEYPYVYWDSDPYLFSIVLAIYSLLWFVLLCGTFNIFYIGRPRKTTRLTPEEFDRRLNEEMAQYLAEKKLNKGVGYDSVVHPHIFFAVVGSFLVFLVYAGFFK